MVTFPNCKINLGLHVVRKREDGFHDLETVFYPIALRDALEIVPSSGKETTLTISGLKIESGDAENICIRAYNLLKKDFDLPPLIIHLHKLIPIGAGLGGGSSDGAFMLLLLNKKFNLNLPEDALIKYALELGSDCPFFIKNTPCFALGRGEILKPIKVDLSGYKIVLVNPGIHISTALAFSKIRPTEHRISVSEIIQQPLNSWKENLVNDFEETIFEKHPELKEIKELLYSNGAVYASMSGTGSCIYGIFQEKESLPLKENYAIHWI